MICELTNNMLKVITYVFDGEADLSMVEDSHSALSVIMWTFMFIVIIVSLGWWVIPLRKLGVYDIRVYCDKKE